jgi:hypothetical protein
LPALKTAGTRRLLKQTSLHLILYKQKLLIFTCYYSIVMPLPVQKDSSSINLSLLVKVMFGVTFTFFQSVSKSATTKSFNFL